MRVLAIIVTAAAMYCSTRYACADELIRLAQTAGTQQVSPATPGLPTPVTSTVTNCMMTCNSKAASCQTTCVVPPASPVSSAAAAGTP